MKKVFNTIVSLISTIISSIANPNPVMTVETAKRTASELRQLKLDTISFIDEMIARCDDIVDEATLLVEELNKKKQTAQRVLEGCAFCRTRVLDHFRSAKSAYDITLEKFNANPADAKLLEAMQIALMNFSKEQAKVNVLLQSIEDCESKWGKVLAEVSAESKSPVSEKAEDTANKKVCLIDTNGKGTVALRTNRLGKTVNNQFPFAKFEGNNVFLQTSNEKAEGIDKAFFVAVAEGKILPDKEYLCVVHQSAKGNLFVQSVADKEGNILVAEHSNLEEETIPLAPLADETHGTYSILAEALTKAYAKKEKKMA